MRIDKFSLAAVLVVLIGIACAGHSGDWEGPGDWKGGAEGTMSAAVLEAYFTGSNDGKVYLTWTCFIDGDRVEAVQLGWSGPEDLGGDVVVSFRFDDEPLVVGEWYSTFGNQVGPGSISDRDEFLSRLVQSEHLSADLLTLSGLVQARFRTYGVDKVRDRMDDHCG